MAQASRRLEISARQWLVAAIWREFRNYCTLSERYGRLLRESAYPTAMRARMRTTRAALSSAKSAMPTAAERTTRNQSTRVFWNVSTHIDERHFGGTII